MNNEKTRPTSLLVVLLGKTLNGTPLLVCGRKMSQTVGEAILVQHMFSFRNYKVPTKCSHCNNLLKGFSKQGLHCKRCKLNIHQGCEDGFQKTCIPIVAGQHNFKVKTFKTVTFCDYCTLMLKGFSNQGLKCNECKAVIHYECQAQLDANCSKIKTQLRIMKETGQKMFKTTNCFLFCFLTKMFLLLLLVKAFVKQIQKRAFSIQKKILSYYFFTRLVDERLQATASLLFIIFSAYCIVCW